MSIEKSYDAWSKQYDTNENKTRDLDQKATIQTLSRYAFTRVVELGCGTGKNTAWLLQNATHIMAIDFSQGMLNIAKEKIADQRVQFKRADLTKKWAIGHNVADLITCSLCLEHIKDLAHIFRQAYQVLQKDGLFFISELHPFKQYSGSKARYETSEGIQELEGYVHHISAYLTEAEKSNFKLVEIKEWFDQEEARDIPRLVSFVFKK